MKKKRFFFIFVCFSLVFLFYNRIEARQQIHDILNKGSKWALNVDGEIGTLELLGGRGGKKTGGGWEMTMEVKWQGNAGTLKGFADGQNYEQRIILNVRRKNGIKVTCEGYIAKESGHYMAGITRHNAVPKDIHGAWFASKYKIEKEILDTGRSSEGQNPSPAIPVKPQAGTILKKTITGKLSISGKVYGSGLKSAKAFFIMLYGPDNLSSLQDIKKFDREGGYTFTGLPEGKYRLVVNSKSDGAVGPHPAYRIVRCSSDNLATQNVNFELK
jgi:hypothetical protein